MSKEAEAGIKINELLKEAGWTVFDGAEGRANIVLENNVKITESRIGAPITCIPLSAIYGQVGLDDEIKPFCLKVNTYHVSVRDKREKATR